jgi:hypothetical protein
MPAAAAAAAAAADTGPIMPRALASEVRVETLVAEQLRGAQLSLLESDKLTEGLQKYVQGDAGAIKGECVPGRSAGRSGDSGAGGAIRIGRRRGFWPRCQMGML